MTEITVQAVVAKYLELRDAKAAIEEEAKSRVAGIVESLAKIEAYLLTQAQAQGVDSFRTSAGTAYVTKTDFASVADWDTLLQYIIENEAWELLQRAVTKTAVRDMLDTKNQLPPGVNFGQRLNVNVRRPSAKVE